MTAAAIQFYTPTLGVISSGTVYNLPSSAPDEVTIIWNAADAAPKSMTIPPPALMVVPNTIVIKDKYGNAGTYNIVISIFGGVGTIEGASSLIINTNNQSIVLKNDGQGNYAIVSVGENSPARIGAPLNLSQVAQRCGVNGEFSTVVYPFLGNHSRHLCPGGADLISLVYSGFLLEPSEAPVVPGCYQAINVTYSGGTGYAVGDVDVFNPTATNGYAPIQTQIMSINSGAPTLVQVLDGGLFTGISASGMAPSYTTGLGTTAIATFTWKGGAYGVRASIEPVWDTQTFTGVNAIEPVVIGSTASSYAGQQFINILVPCGQFVQTDPIPVNVPIGGAIGIRATYVGNNSPYGRRPIGSFYGSTNAANYEFSIANPNNTYSPGDIAVSNTSIGASTTNNLLQPMLILGAPKLILPNVMCSFADSRATGGSSGTGAIGSYCPLDNDGNSGWFELAMASSGVIFWPWVNMARGSDRASYAIPALNPPYTNPLLNGRIQRLKAMAIARPTAVYINLSINDFINGESVATVLAYEQQLVTEARACGAKYVFTDTTDPNTTSSDSWATVANQTLSQNQSTYLAVRNSGLFNGSYNPGYDFVIDQRPNVEYFASGAYTGKWIASTTGDGIHATPAVIIKKAATAAKAMLVNISVGV